MKQKAVDRKIRPADQVAAELLEALPAMMQFVRAKMRDQQDPSLSVTQFRALAFVSRNPDVSLTEVSDYLGITTASASTMIGRLVDRGLVDRQEDPKERRHVMLNLTQTGGDRLDEMKDILRQTIAQLFDELSPEELKSVSEALAVLGRVFNAANLKRSHS